MNTFRGRKALPLLVAGLAAGGVCLMSGLPASASADVAAAAAGATFHVAGVEGPVDPWFTGLSRHVYTSPGVPVEFTAAPDPVTGESRSIVIDPAFDSSGCTYDPVMGDTTGTCLVAVVEISPTGSDDRGSLAVTADTSDFALTPLAFGGAFSVGGTADQIQSVLSSLSYIPPDATYVTPDDDPVPIHVVLFESDGYVAPVDVDAVAADAIHDEYLYVHVVEPPAECAETPEVTEPPVETPDPTDPPVETVPTTEPTESTEPEGVPDTTEPTDVPDTTEPEGPTLTTPDDFTIPTITIVPVPIEIPSLGEPSGGAFGFSRPVAVPQPVECPPDTTTPGDDNGVPSGMLPETGSPTLLIAAFAGLLTASGITLLAVRGSSRR